MALAAGTRLGPYEILAQLGAGGMGEVYRALDHRLGREVAIKTLPESLGADPDRRTRFEREARALAALAHPSIATLHEIGEVEGRPFLVMELVEGQTLGERLEAGSLPLIAVLTLATQLADGLAAAHARGVVHRDLKPSNLALTSDGRLKILDFGLAKTGAGILASGPDLSRSPTAAVALTSSGMLLGTAGYMSPEQVRGQPVDGRADIWAFGCILYEMLAGNRAFRGSSPWEVLAAVMNDEPDWSKLPPELPPAIAEILHRCLEKEPRRRLADLAEARLALGGPASAATWVSVARPSRLRPVVSRRAALLGLGAVAIAAAAAGVWWWRQQSTTTEGLPTLAILPFRALGSGEQERWLGEGLAAAVSSELVNVSGMRVFPAWTTLQAVEKGADPMRVAKSLGADLVLNGTVQSAGGQVRVTFSLLQAPVGTQLTGGSVTSPVGSLFAAQDELSGEVLSALELVRPRHPADDSGLPRPDQQDRYLQALGHLQRYDQAKHIDDAVALLETLAKEAPESPLVFAALGRAFLHRFAITHDPSWAPLARSYCERARQLSPRRPEVELTLAQLALRTGEPAKAIALLRHALTVQPGNSDSTLALAQAWDALGDPEAAEASYRRLIALQPGYWAAYSKLGGFFFAHGRFRESAEMFRRVTELNPDSARGFNNLSGALLAAGDFDGALAASRRSIALEPTGAALANLGTLQFYVGDYDEAALSFVKASELTPASLDVWLNLGDAYRWSEKRRAEAAAAYRRAIALGREQLGINPKDDATRAHVAMALAKSGDLGAAAEELRRLRAERGGPESFYAQALVATLDGRSGEAVELLRRAVAAGYDRWLLARDPEFVPLRGQRGFLELLGEARGAA